MMKSAESYLAGFGLDGLLSPELLATARVIRYSPGDLIVSSGDTVETLFLFVEGKAKAYTVTEDGRVLLVGFHRPLWLLGDLELFSRDRIVCSIEAMTDSACIALSADRIRKTAAENWRFLRYLCATLGNKLAEYNEASVANLRYPVEQRLASYLLAVTEGGEGNSGPVTVGELADFLGTSYRQLSRVLRRFRAEGLIGTGRGLGTVRDAARLKVIAADLYV